MYVPLIATSVSLSPYESCLVDSMGHILLVSLTTLDPTSSPLLAQDSQSSK